jgi:RNA polymerase-binding transcription factor DksA
MANLNIPAIKEQLLADKARVEQELAQFSHRSPNPGEPEFQVEFKDVGTEEGDNAAEAAQYSDNLSMEEELEKSLKDIDGALKLIEAGTYGTCKYCKLPIDERRLAARPTSSSCIQCKKTLTQEM